MDVGVKDPDLMTLLGSPLCTNSTKSYQDQSVCEVLIDRQSKKRTSHKAAKNETQKLEFETGDTQSENRELRSSARVLSFAAFGEERASHPNDSRMVLC